MTRVLIGALLGVLSATPALAQFQWPQLTPLPRTGGGEQDAAVVVAIEDYLVPGVPDIAGALQNGRDWYLYLTGTRGVPVSRVRFIRDSEATREELLEAVRRAAGQVGEGGTLWFVFIGHGAPSSDGKDGALIGADAQQTAASLYARSVTKTELLELTAAARGTTLMLLDACFSGRSNTGAPLAAGLQPLLAIPEEQLSTRTVILTAAQGNQFAGPLPYAARPAFSYLVLGGLRGWADQDKDGRVTAAEAYEYAAGILAVAPIGRSQAPVVAGEAGGLTLSHGLREQGPRLEDLLAHAGPPAAPSSASIQSPPPGSSPLPVEPAADGGLARWRDIQLHLKVNLGGLGGGLRYHLNLLELHAGANAVAFVPGVSVMQAFGYTQVSGKLAVAYRGRTGLQTWSLRLGGEFNARLSLASTAGSFGGVTYGLREFFIGVDAGFVGELGPSGRISPGFVFQLGLAL